MIFEYCEHDFLQIIHHHSQTRTQISVPILKTLLWQLCNGVAYLQTILLNETAGSTVPLDMTLATLDNFRGADPLATLARDAPDAVFDTLLRQVAP